jgi:hypothetical protein
VEPPANGDGAQWVTSATSPDERGEPIRPAGEDEIGPVIPPPTPGPGMPGGVGRIGDV